MTASENDCADPSSITIRCSADALRMDRSIRVISSESTGEYLPRLNSTTIISSADVVGAVR